MYLVIPDRSFDGKKLRWMLVEQKEDERTPLGYGNRNEMLDLAVQMNRELKDGKTEQLHAESG